MEGFTTFIFEQDPLLIVLPLIGAVIGWLTNFIAVKMLFHPRRELRLLFLSIQGVFPKRQKALARKLGEIVSTELISADDVTEKLMKHATSDETLEKIGDKIEDVITGKLPVVIPMIAMVLNPDIIRTVREAFIPDLKSLMEELALDLRDGLEKELDVHEIVEEKVASFSSDKLEEILFTIMRREFRFIELVGAVLGFLIGCVQVILVYFSMNT